MYCGAQLAPNAAGCGQCGRPIAQAPQQMPYGQQQQPPMGYAQQQQQQQPYAQPPGGQLPYGQPQQPPMGYGQQQPPGGQLPYGGGPPQGYQPPMGYGNTPSLQPPTPAPWKWGYSRWVGIHYGPIPVGIIIAVIILIAYSSNN